jgi:hypothetical protein
VSTSACTSLRLQVDHPEDRERERGGLAGAGLRLADDVAPGEQEPLLLIGCVHRKGTPSHRALARNAQQLKRSRMKVVLTLERATASFESWLS